MQFPFNSHIYINHKPKLEYIPNSLMERKIVADRLWARNQQQFMGLNCFLWTRTKYAGHWSKYLISYEFIKYLFEEAVTMEQCAYLTIST